MKNQAQSIIYNPEWTPDGTRERYRWIENASRGLRIVGPAHEVADRLASRGWYMDPTGDYGRDGTDLAVGYVLQLPSREGLPLYVPAILDDVNPDCYVVDFHNMHDDKVECARDADRMAELYAEREREYRIAQGAEDRIAESREAIGAARRAHTALAAEIRAMADLRTDTPAICEALRAQLAALRRTVSAEVRNIRKLAEDPNAWLY